MGRRKEAKDGRSRVDNVLSVSYNVLSVSNNYMSSPCQYIVLSVSNNVLSVSRQGPLRVKTIPLRPVFTRVRGLVCGNYGECSPDVHELLSLCQVQCPLCHLISRIANSRNEAILE